MLQPGNVGNQGVRDVSKLALQEFENSVPFRTGFPLLYALLETPFYALLYTPFYALLYTPFYALLYTPFYALLYTPFYNNEASCLCSIPRCIT